MSKQKPGWWVVVYDGERVVVEVDDAKRIWMTGDPNECPPDAVDEWVLRLDIDTIKEEA